MLFFLDMLGVYNIVKDKSVIERELMWNFLFKCFRYCWKMIVEKKKFFFELNRRWLEDVFL